MSANARYEVLDESHGMGGFGKISKQRDRFLERLVAVKTQHLFADSETRQRFIGEAKTLAKMSHPYIPSIYDVVFEGDEMMIYFEFIEGDNLRKHIQQGTIPSVQQAVLWFTNVASALEHASGLGIIHRDIKPENIIISQNTSAAYLVDFGIALRADDIRRITDTGYVVGTRDYMSPEQRNGEDLDPVSDIYSLGLTLYETLSGHLPLPGQNYERLSDSNEAIPPGIDDLIKDCLIPERDRRLASAHEFGKKLQSVFRTDIPLADLLTVGRLHELQAALQNMSPEEFSKKGKGQKLLVIRKAKDLIRTDKPQLLKPTADFLAILVRLALHEPPDQYKIVADAAYEWGYEKEFSLYWHGDEGIRDALIYAARNASASSHAVLSKSLLEFAERSGLDGKEKWYYSDLRKNISSLLANPNCEDIAESLGELDDRIIAITYT